MTKMKMRRVVVTKSNFFEICFFLIVFQVCSWIWYCIF
jgi:hypothetical protein